MKLKYILVIIIVFCLSAVFFNYFLLYKEPEETTEDGSSYLENQNYDSPTQKEDCYVCGSNPESTLTPYWGEHNIGLINLNTFECCRFEINRYDEALNIIEKQQRYNILRTSGLSNSDGSIISYTLDSDRGYMSGTITLNENSFLELEKLQSYLCSQCLTGIMNKYLHDEKHWDIAVVDFLTKEIHPLYNNVSGFLRNDYKVDCIYDEDRNMIDFQAFYCPIRFSELEYDENESVLSQIENYCDGIGLQLILDDELLEFLGKFDKITGITTFQDSKVVSFQEYSGKAFNELIIYEDGSYDIYFYP